MQRANWALDGDELEILKERAAYHGMYFDGDDLDAFNRAKDQSFKDFEKKYLKATEIFTDAPENVAGFQKSKTIEDAEKYAAQFVDPSGFGSVGLSYKGVHIDVANEINKALYKFYSTFDVEKLNGIAAPAKNTKLGKMIDARAAYSPVRRSLLMNRANTKSLKLFMQGFEEDAKALEDILAHPEKYDLSKLRKSTLTAIEASKEAGRLIVPTNAEESILHELGHHLERVVKIDLDLEESMKKYGSKISGYAAADTSEYFAESLASYMKGENKIDPALKKYFDGLRKSEPVQTIRIVRGMKLIQRGSVLSVRKTYGKSSVRTINAPNGKKYNLVQNKKVVKVIDNSKMSLTRESLKMAGVEYNKVKRLEKALTQKEIIERVGGGDQTTGSCSSLAFAYIGNRAGYDVLDYRGGSSLSVFSTLMYIKDIAKLKGVNSVVIKNYNGFKAVNEALKNVEKGKEYYLSASNHAAIIRKTGRGFEYLELQTTDDNGFKKLTNRNLGTRFGVTKSKTTMGMKVEHQVVLIEAESLYNNKEYIKLLGYINTPKNKQLKGAGGYAK